jgi:hypothetical protein
VIYTSDGNGRDSFIAANSGGFRPLHTAGAGKKTYFNSLRQYKESSYVPKKPVKVNEHPIGGESATELERLTASYNFDRYHDLLKKTRPDELIEA